MTRRVDVTLHIYMDGRWAEVELTPAEVRVAIEKAGDEAE